MTAQPKCPNGGCDVCALGGDCRTYGKDGYPVTAPTPALDRLDFEAAGLVWFAQLEGRDCRALLNAQVAEVVRAEREKMAETVASAYHEGRDQATRQEQKKSEALRALVRGWQEARKAWHTNAYPGATTALIDAEAALAAYPLEGL